MTSRDEMASSTEERRRVLAATVFSRCYLLAEGPPAGGKRLLIVEDVVTSGGQIRLSAADLRDLGASVLGALCIVDREEGGSENLAKDGIVLQSLFRASELEAAARADPQYE